MRVPCVVGVTKSTNTIKHNQRVDPSSPSTNKNKQNTPKNQARGPPQPRGPTPPAPRLQRPTAGDAAIGVAYRGVDVAVAGRQCGAALGPEVRARALFLSFSVYDI